MACIDGWVFEVVLAQGCEQRLRRMAARTPPLVEGVGNSPPGRQGACPAATGLKQLALQQGRRKAWWCGWPWRDGRPRFDAGARTGPWSGAAAAARCSIGGWFRGFALVAGDKTIKQTSGLDFAERGRQPSGPGGQWPFQQRQHWIARLGGLAPAAASTRSPRPRTGLQGLGQKRRRQIIIPRSIPADLRTT